MCRYVGHTLYSLTVAIVILTGFVTLGMYLLRPPRLSIIIQPLCGVLAIVATADAIRLRNPSFERTYERLLGPLMRASEKVRALRNSLWSTRPDFACLSKDVRQRSHLVSHRCHIRTLIVS